jgi:hypothetical protein
VGDRTPSASLVPLPEAVAAEVYQLEAVATAITRDEIGVARQLLGRIDRDALWSYYDTAGKEWGRRHRREDHFGGSATNRRRIPDATKLEVATRDGWRCRYCGVRLISFDFSRKLNELFPDVWVIDPAVERKMHPAAYLFRYTQDHVVAHAVGGDNSAGNLVACCGTCQYQKGSCSLEEMGLVNPLSRPPIRDGWDGLSGRFGPIRY